jgi:ribosomal protein S18 acetylase RimI-like enzyme
MSAAPVELRLLLLSPAEAALYREIRLEALSRDADMFSSTFAEENARPLSFFANRLANSAVFGAFRGSELLGIAGFFVQPGPKHAHKGMLVGMYVRPGARGAGVGRLLVGAVITHARRRVELIQLSVNSDNSAARRLYASLGFAEYGLEQRATKYHGRYHDEVLMAKMLTAGPEPGAALAPQHSPPSGGGEGEARR